MNSTDIMLPKDKANHYVWGSLAACLAAALAPHVGIPPNIAAQSGSALVGVLKEAYDWKFRGKQPDFRDFLVTSAAGTPIAALLI